MPWLIATLVLCVAAAVAFVWEARRIGASGSNPVGLTLGIIAFALMLYAAGLGLKRRVPHWRLGKAQTWMRGHIWMGLAIVLLVALHGNFSLGGPLTTWLWILLGVVTVSGFFGILLQQFLPSLLLHTVPGETVAQQLRREIEALPGLAKAVVIKFAGGLEKPAPAWEPGHDAKPPAGGEPLRRFYHDHVAAFLAGRDVALLDNPARAEAQFNALRTMTPDHIHPGVTALKDLCDRRKQLLHQRFWMRLLHAWLIIHVPLSWLLLLLTAAHAVLALRWHSPS